MQWKRKEAGKYQSKDGRWWIKGADTKWTLWDMQRPKGKRKVLTTKSKKLCQEEAVMRSPLEGDIVPTENARVLPIAEPDPVAVLVDTCANPETQTTNPRKSITVALQELRLAMDQMCFKTVELGQVIREWVEQEGRR